MDYDDLVIQLGAGAAGEYTVRVSRSLAGESDPEPLVVPVGEGEIDRLAALFGRAARDLQPVAAADEVSEASLVALGERLFRALLPAAAEGRYHESVGQIAARADRGLRLRIQMGLGNPAMARLHSLPWEYLHTPEVGFLALRRRMSIARHLDLGVPADRPPAPPPLAILAVACEDPALDLERERRAIEGAWAGQGSVHFKPLCDATLGSLREELLARSYHVLHFMGHGGFDPAAGEGSLAFRDEAGRRVWVGGSELAEQVGDHPSLRIVVLNACWTARASSSGPYAGVATALLKAGIPAVLAMQFAISDAAALAFSGVFYRRLACGDTVDEAVTEGRLAMRNGKRRSFEWGTPALFLRLSGGRVVEPSRPAPPRGPTPWRRLVAPALSLFALLLLLWQGVSRLMPDFASPFEPAATVSVIHKQKPIRSPGARIYDLTAGEPIVIAELATRVVAEFSQAAEGPRLMLHVGPPGSPSVDRVVMGTIGLDLAIGPGPGHLVVLGIDWNGQSVRLSAEPHAPPAQAIAQCSDGSYSFSASRGGTCSSHHGLVRWLHRTGLPPS